MSTELLGPPDISVVSPVYRADAIVEELVRRIVASLDTSARSFEIVLVDDCSPDASWDRICEANRADQRVRGIRLAHNVGQHRAIRAGLEAARGQYVIVIDCDLQDDPADIGRLLDVASQGYAVVYTYKAARKHSATKNLTARAFYALLGAQHAEEGEFARLGVGAFSVLSRQVVDQYLRIRDVHAHYLVNLRALGYRSTVVEVQHHDRHAGKSSYSLRKLIHHGIDGFVSQSARLLNLTVGLGAVLLVGSLLWAMYLIAFRLLRGALPGYTSLMVTILFSTGAMLLSMGILGLYIGRIFEQVQGRPPYSVEFSTDIEPQ